MRHFRRVLPEEEYPLHVGRPCHECAGVVVKSQDESLRPGQKVIVLPTDMHGLAEFLPSSPKRIIPLPDDADLSTFIMCQPVGTVMYSCSRIGPVVGKTVVVQGAGAIGLTFAHLLARYGAEHVVAIDPLQYRLDKAMKVGATNILNPLREDVVGAVSELTGGEMADVVVEAAGTPESVNRSIDLVRKGGAIALFGLTQEPVIAFEHYKMSRRYPVIIPTVSSATEDPTEFIKKAVGLVEQGRLDVSWLVTHHFDFDDLQKAYDMYDQRSDGVIKVVMQV